MKNDYERSRYKKWYIAASVIMIACALAWVLFAYGKITCRTGGLIGIFVAFLVVVYFVSFKKVDKLYNEIEVMSETMEKFIEDNENLPEEEYREGTIGIFYTNFYKMIEALKESRDRELQEKIFLRDIISDISHQLKTPLASLNVFIDLLLDDKIDEQKKQQVLREAANQLDRMEWMVLSMLKLARIEAGAIIFEKTENGIEGIFARVAEGTGILIKKKNQELICKCGENDMLICDADWLIEALINLVKNASDYSDESKRIWLEAECNKLYTRIYVKDEGVGIAEDELPNIFKRFYRVHSEVNPNSVGIGLSLSKSIIEGMGGSLTVTSTVGEGSTFIVTFVA